MDESKFLFVKLMAPFFSGSGAAAAVVALELASAAAAAKAAVENMSESNN